MTKKYKKVQSRKRCISLGIKLTSDCLFQLGEMKSELQKSLNVNIYFHRCTESMRLFTSPLKNKEFVPDSTVNVQHLYKNTRF